ncbi:MAG: hypothetical protein OER56_09335 [Hyphomicrobiales bacterium]|nr:hypothetical protein [Hyphomicrobiales bacterium]
MTSPDETTYDDEGPFAGSTCVAGMSGYWAGATITRINEDGTFTVMLDGDTRALMPYWYGLTPPEILFNDEAGWPPLFDQLRGRAPGLTLSLAHKAFERLGVSVDDDEMVAFWAASLKALHLDGPGDAASACLDAEQAYEVFLRAGFCARQIGERLAGSEAPETFQKLYWNQIRMGGRDPAEVAGDVTLDHLIEALGLTGRSESSRSASRLEAFERRHNIALPETLKRFLCRNGAEQAVLATHPNNPELLAPGGEDWELRTRADTPGLPADYAVTIMRSHSGDHEWAAVFSAGDTDAQVFISEEDDDECSWHEHWKLTAPASAFFFWDLAQTGLAWFCHTKHEGGLPTRQTGIGLALKAAPAGFALGKFFGGLRRRLWR